MIRWHLHKVCWISTHWKKTQENKIGNRLVYPALLITRLAAERNLAVPDIKLSKDLDTWATGILGASFLKKL